MTREEALHALNKAYFALCWALWSNMEERITLRLSFDEDYAYFEREMRAFHELKKQVEREFALKYTMVDQVWCFV
jgi:hypothetical protein